MKQLFLYFFILLLCVKVSAQNTLRLSDAINIALKNSLDVQLSKNNVEANTTLNNYGVAGGLPTVAGTLSDNEQVTTINQKLNSGVNISRKNAATNNLVVGVTGSILLYNGDRVVATKSRLGLLVSKANNC